MSLALPLGASFMPNIFYYMITFFLSQENSLNLINQNNDAVQYS
jgi:hypothetical protein